MPHGELQGEQRSVDDVKAAARIPTLDGVRGVAILLVLVTHLTGFGGPGAFDKWSQYFLWGGWIGVDLFFVLSGFLITGILLDTRSLPIKRYFKNFYVRRALRIFPLYYGVLLASVFVLPRVLPAAKGARFAAVDDNLPYYFAYLQNYTIASAGRAQHAVLDITWSLAIEEQFYVVWPVVVYLCTARTLKIVCWCLVAGAFGARLGATLFTELTPFGIYVLTPCRVDALAAGALVALATRRPAGTAAWTRPAAAAFFVSGLVALAIVVIEPFYGLAEFWEPGFGRISLIVGFSLLALCFASLLVLILNAREKSALSSIFRSTPLVWLGTYSYGLYLIHLPVRAVIRDKLYGPAYAQPPYRFHRLGESEFLGQLLFYPLAMLPILAIAWLSYHFYEKHFLKLKRYFH